MAKSRSPGAVLLCAIYTRKSSEEGLGQDFNSLQAQREACEAFIRSQRHEGWSVVPTKYDDGGYSGGTLQRPALEKLLADIRAQKVNVVVVYKIDRLTRSLFDFAKIIEVFDSAGVSFVSVTQQFNTTTSMGRLTLNVLLSFAQFEREVTGERIRDKIAASKRKGMWMGGRAPLGFEIKNRKLHVVETEAQVIRQLFDLYLRHGNVRVVKDEFDRTKLGTTCGRGTFSRGHIYKILSNPIYAGRIGHKGEVFDGQHQAIVPADMWDKVRQNLETRTIRPRSHGAKEPSPLAGILFDETGDRLTPSHAVKNGRRYRYYIAHRLVRGGKQASGMRLPAAEVESAVAAAIVDLLGNQQQLFELLKLEGSSAQAQLRRAEKLRSDFQKSSIQEQLLAMKPVLQKIAIKPHELVLRLRIDALPAWIAGLNASGKTEKTRLFDLAVPLSIQWRGREMRLILSNVQEAHARVDETLIRLVACGYRWRHEIVQGLSASAVEIARREGLTDAYVCRLMGLSFLAPELISGILAGHAPITELRVLGCFPLDWRSQRDVLNSRT
jgi:site-specific DNA recombinase